MGLGDRVSKKGTARWGRCSSLFASRLPVHYDQPPSRHHDLSSMMNYILSHHFLLSGIFFLFQNNHTKKNPLQYTFIVKVSLFFCNPVPLAPGSPRPLHLLQEAARFDKSPHIGETTHGVGAGIPQPTASFQACIKQGFHLFEN